MGSVENVARRNLPDLIGEPDSLGNLGVGETGLSRFRDMVLDAGYTVAAHCSTKRYQFAFALVEIVHALLLSNNEWSMHRQRRLPAVFMLQHRDDLTGHLPPSTCSHYAAD
jgi:hypothetical protein